MRNESEKTLPSGRKLQSETFEFEVLMNYLKPGDILSER